MTKQAILEIILKAKDQASGVLDTLRSKFGSLHAIANTIKGAFASLIGIIPEAAGVAAGFLSASVQSAAAFEQKMSGVKAVLKPTADQFQRLNTLALDLGRVTKFSAEEAAEALETLSKQGVDYKAIMAGAGMATLDLAAATGGDLVSAAGVASSAVNVFNLKGSDMPKVADRVAASINNANHTLTDFSYSVQQGGSAAQAAGLSYEDFVTAITIFAESGIKGERAGTGLRQMLLNLIPQTKKQIEMFNELGLVVNGQNQFFDASTGKIKDLDQVAGLLRSSMSHLTDEQRLHTLQVMFGARAMQFANILYGEGAEGVREWKKELGDVSAHEIAETRMDNLKGSIERFRGELETAKITLGRGFLPVAKRLVDWAEETLHKAQPLFSYFGENAPRFLDRLIEKIEGLLGIDVSKWINGIMGAFDNLMSDAGHQNIREFRVGLSLDDQGMLDKGRGAGALDKALKDAFGEENVQGVKDMGEAMAILGPQVLALAKAFGTLSVKTAGFFKDGLQGWQTFNDAMDRLPQATADALFSMEDSLSNTKANIGQSWREMTGEAQQAGFDLGVSVAQSMTSVESSVETNLSAARSHHETQWAAMKDSTSTRMEEIRTSVDTKWNEATTAASGWLQQQGFDLGVSLAANYLAVQTKMEEIRTTVDTKWREAKEQAKKWLDEHGINTEDGLRGVFDTVVRRGEETLASYDKTWEDIKTRAKEWLDRHGVDTEEGLTGVVRRFAEKGSAALEAVNTWMSKLPEVARKWLEQKREMVSSQLERLKSWLSNFWEDLKDKAHDWGRDFVKGLKDGMKSYMDDILEWATTQFTKLVDTVNTILGPFRSPSVKATRMGRMFAQGIGVGIVSQLPNEGARIVRSMKQHVVDPVQHALGAGAVSGSLNPFARMVVDDAGGVGGITPTSSIAIAITDFIGGTLNGWAQRGSVPPGAALDDLKQNVIQSGAALDDLKQNVIQSGAALDQMIGKRGTVLGEAGSGRAGSGRTGEQTAPMIRPLIDAIFRVPWARMLSHGGYKLVEENVAPAFRRLFEVVVGDPWLRGQARESGQEAAISFASGVKKQGSMMERGAFEIADHWAKGLRRAGQAVDPFASGLKGLGSAIDPFALGQMRGGLLGSVGARAGNVAGPQFNISGRRGSGGLVAASSANFWQVWSRHHGLDIPEGVESLGDPFGEKSREFLKAYSKRVRENKRRRRMGLDELPLPTPEDYVRPTPDISAADEKGLKKGTPISITLPPVRVEAVLSLNGVEIKRFIDEMTPKEAWGADLTVMAV